MKFSVIVISFFVMVLCLTHAFFVHSSQICPAPIPEKFQKVQPGNIVAAYFTSWGTYEIAEIAPVASVLTHIIYAFAIPSVVDGSCSLYESFAKKEVVNVEEVVVKHIEQLKNLKKEYPHLKILLSIGGASASKILPEIARRGLLDACVQSLIHTLDAYHFVDDQGTAHTISYTGLFDGLDLDWEFGSAQNAAEYATAYQGMIQKCFILLQERSKKQKTKSVLTCAIEVNRKIIESLNLISVVRYVDWFHVMTYDYANSSSSGIGLNAPICNPWSNYSVDNTMNFLMNLNISPEKLVLGIPLYGQAFDQTQEKLGSIFKKTTKTKALTYAQIKELYLQNKECNQKWHSKSHVPYVYCPNSKIFVSYDDERSVTDKVAYAKNKHLQGVVFWRLFGDGKDHEIIKSVKI